MALPSHEGTPSFERLPNPLVILARVEQGQVQLSKVPGSQRSLELQTQAPRYHASGKVLVALVLKHWHQSRTSCFAAPRTHGVSGGFPYALLYSNSWMVTQLQVSITCDLQLQVLQIECTCKPYPKP